MIPEQAIVEWRREAPWDANALVEQDLIISRALVEMYSQAEIADRLAFPRGHRALQAASAAGRSANPRTSTSSRSERGAHRRHAFDLVRGVLDPWLGPATQAERGPRQPPVSLRLRRHAAGPNAPENRDQHAREHFTKLGLVRVPFQVDSQWFRGEADDHVRHRRSCWHESCARSTSAGKGEISSTSGSRSTRVA
ncbi:MAG: hypothetical protein R3F39_06730 [Myxococcota bacterium]